MWHDFDNVIHVQWLLLTLLLIVFLPTTNVHLPVLKLQNTVPRVAAERSAERQVNCARVKKPVKKVLRMIAEIINSGGSATLVSICDHIHKRCTIRGTDAAVLVQNVRSACQLAVKNGFLMADDKVFSITDAGTGLLESSRERTASTPDLLLDKLLAEKVRSVVVLYIVYLLVDL